MELKLTWNGREITGDEPEYQEHFREIIIRDVIPYALAHPERTANAIRFVPIEESYEKK